MGVPTTNNPILTAEQRKNGEFIYNGVHFNADNRESQNILVFDKQKLAEGEKSLISLARPKDFDSKVHKKLTPQELAEMVGPQGESEKPEKKTSASKKTIDAKEEDLFE